MSGKLNTVTAQFNVGALKFTARRKLTYHPGPPNARAAQWHYNNTVSSGFKSFSGLEAYGR